MNKNKNVAKKSDFKPKQQGMQDKLDGAPYKEKLTKRNSSKMSRRLAETADTAAAMSRDNPLVLYTKMDPFVRDAATLPFAQPLGASLQMGNTSVGTVNMTVPGVMALHFAPTVGVSTDYSSPINRASIRFYTYMRSNQKASASYDHQDVTMMLTSMDSAYMFHSFMKRAYGVINLFSPTNEYYSRVLIKAMGLDWDDFRANIQDFRAYINAYAYSLGQYAIPKDLTFIDRHTWMCEGIYVDSPSSKAQTYLWVPQYYWIYDNTSETGGRCLQKQWFTGSNTGTKTFAQVKQFGDALINAVSNEEDFAVISGDIYNFYGGSVYQVDYVSEGYTILPAFEKTVLSQIENATIVGSIGDFAIQQTNAVNNGAIISQPYSTTITEMTLIGAPMNFHWDRPTPDDVIEASRLSIVGHTGILSNGTTSVQGYIIDSCGTELLVRCQIFTDLTSSPVTIDSWVLEVNDAQQPSQFMYEMKKLLYLSQFDWAPQVVVIDVQSGSGSVTNVRLLGTSWDIDNYDVVPTNYITNLNTAVLLGLFTAGPNR